MRQRRNNIVMAVKNILLVDDDLPSRRLADIVLQDAKVTCTVSEAKDGKEAIEMLRNSDELPDVILLDINMPVMDGLEFIKQLPGVPNAKDVPVVMITTEGSESHVVQALSCGARGYIRKPFTPDQVKEHVVPVLGGKI